MTCTNHCCGFLALSGMVGLGALTVSHGLGSCPFNPIEFPTEDLYKTGTGLTVRGKATKREGPTVAVRYPERRSSGVCTRRRKK